MKIITHEFISEEWLKDQPNEKTLSKNLDNLQIITLTFENKINKYRDYYYTVLKQMNVLEREKKKTYKLLKLYYLKKLSDEEIEENNLPHLNIAYNKTEIEMLIKAHDKYRSVEEDIILTQAIKEEISDYIDFIKRWGFNQQKFFDMLKFRNGE